MSQVSVVQFNNILQQTDRQIIVLRKPPEILPRPKEFPKQDVLITNTARKKKSKEAKSQPQPIAVARRNARERNRVKQVNNGFATLRQHIPNFVVAAFENTHGRGANKKFSKVETLRMAVEYIRSLEELLNMDTEHASELSYPSPCSSVSPSHPQGTLLYSYRMSPSIEDDDVSSTATPPPDQFIKLNSADGYTIIPGDLYEDHENLDPMIVNEELLSDPNLLDFSETSQDLSYLNSMHASDSLSPGFYSESSASPNAAKSPDSEVRIKSEQQELPVLTLKTENGMEGGKENMVTVMQWWEGQPHDEERCSYNDLRL
ncbi:unnamed protein product [Acanthoscelides obtectus]|uniref:BHLH domain-containing protein n=1 Tax=Acanthoscelides obtectus TaxID=200917 RepID=A0A9P0L1M5_ACAOB|nr:unnamed protein product [Acanthoscelides obtectus]CAK1676666.1 Achaete-scute complex protein T5 [Acanthoscelides obtectus]